MKKTLQILFLMVISYAGFSQTIFKQDFEGGTIEPMTAVDVDGNTPNANVANYSEAWIVIAGSNLTITDGSMVAASNSWYDPPAQADDWLITPQMNIPDSSFVLTWLAQAVDPDFADGYEVRVSTTDNDIASFTDVIWSVDQEQATEFMERRLVSLKDYVGQDIYIAFRNNSVDKFILALDDIEVKSLKARNATVVNFTSSPYNVLNEDVIISAEVLNNGSETIESIDFNYSIGGMEVSETITGLDIPTGESAVISSSTPFQPTEAISYDVTVWTSNPNGMPDGDDTDDLINGTIAGVTFVPNRKIVGEEGTGTWCGWCPRGAVALQYMDATYPDKWVGIAIHNGDPMAYAEYDAAIGYTGYPGGRVNRSINIDPGNFESVFLQEKDKVSPFTASIDATYDPSNRMVTVSTESEFVTKLDNIDFRAAVVIIENNVTGTGQGWNQANYYGSNNLELIDINGVNYANLPDPIPGEDIVYEHVARTVLGGFTGMEGSIASSVLEGDVASNTFTYEVPEEYDINNMEAVVLIFDNNTGTILNADKAEVKNILAVHEVVDESIAKVYPNPTSNRLFVDVDLVDNAEVTIEVMDMMGKIVRRDDLGSMTGHNTLSYDVTNLNAGMYLFRIKAGKLVANKKVMVGK